MSRFLNNFDQANTNLKISKITLPGTVLALHMLERSGLSANDKKLVMTGVELVKTESVVEDMMNSIKKYFGEGIREVEKRPQCDRPIKEEPVFNGERLFSESSESTRSSSDPDNMSEEEEAYYTNWRNRGKAKPWRRTDNNRSYNNHISRFNRDKRENTSQRDIQIMIEEEITLEVSKKSTLRHLRQLTTLGQLRSLTPG